MLNSLLKLKLFSEQTNFCFSYVFFLELTSQLLAAENKCNLLEKQLEYMRNMIKHAEMERTSVLEKQVSLERERQHDQTHVQNQLEKLDLLEQEYNKLTTMQALAEVSENLLYSSVHNLVLL